MRKVAFIMCLLVLVATLVFVQREKIEWVNASPSTDIFADTTDGYLDSNGVVYSTYPQMSLGDWSNNAYSHCYVKFSLSGVSGTLSSATLNLYVYTSKTNNNSYFASPLANPGLGNCEVIHIADYDTLDSSDFSAVSIGNDPGVLLNGTANPNIGYVSIDVRAAMQDDINHGRTNSTFMLQMSTSTDGNNDNDYWAFYTSRDASPDHHPYVAYDLLHQGDLILTGNNVTTITGRFDINGSIIVSQNATLILKDAILNFTQSAIYQHNITLRNPANGNPCLESNNSTITSNLKWFKVALYGNSSATMTNSTDTAYLALYNSAVASVSNSSIYFLDMYGFAVASVFNSTFGYCLQAYDSSTVTVSNSTIHSMLAIHSASVNCSPANIGPGFFNLWDYQSNSTLLIGSGGSAPNVTLSSTTVENWQLSFDGASNVTIRDSTLYYLDSYDSTTVWLVNTTVAIPDFLLQGKAYVSWYLDVHVIDYVGQDIPAANVTATYPNATKAASELTDFEGLSRLTLMEKMMNSTGSYPIGNYTIQASYQSYSSGTSVNMTQSQEISLQLKNSPVSLYVPTSSGVFKISLTGTAENIISSSGNSIDVLGNELYVFHAGQEIDVYDLQGNFLRAIIPPSEAAQYYVGETLPGGRFALMDNANDTVYFINSTSSLLATTNMLNPPDDQLQNLDGVVVGDQLIVSEDGNMHVLQFNLTSYENSTFKDLSSLSGAPDHLPWLGPITYSEGKYYICGPKQIYSFTDSTAPVKIGEIPDGNIVGIVVLDGFAYVTENFNGEIFRVKVTDGTYSLLASGLNYPEDLDVGSPAPLIGSCDSGGAKKTVFNPSDDVYVFGHDYSPSETYDLYVVNDIQWQNQTLIPLRISGTATTVTSNASGYVDATIAWQTPLSPGKYDIIVDVNGNGKYDEGIDALCDNNVQVTAGLIVIPEFGLITAISLIGLYATLEAFYLSKRKRSNP